MALVLLESAGQSGFDPLRGTTKRFGQSRAVMGDNDGLHTRRSSLDQTPEVVTSAVASTLVA
ncbi:MAG: hypothetical protein ABI360_05225, partial [Allobranchiibius sp.]